MRFAKFSIGPQPPRSGTLECSDRLRPKQHVADRKQSQGVLNEKLMEYYTVNRVQHRLPFLRLSNIAPKSSDTFPQLRGKIVKSAATKALVSFLKSLAAEYDCGTPWSLHRRKVCQWLSEIYRIIDEADMFLRAEEITAFKHAVQKFESHYNYLAVNGARRGLFMFNIVPKHHYLQHLALQSELLNPRFVQNYKEEGFVGRVTTLYASCSQGPYKDRIQRTCLCKYLVGLNVLWSNFELGL